ncbi:MAG TPA: hypothetical protein VF218_15255 [Acidothermaceae bacterium]
MNSHLLANQMAAEHHRELINEAAGWRRGREARRAARAQAAASLAAERARADAAVYCRRAAAHAAGCTV